MEKRSKNRENLHKAIYVTIDKTTLLSPTQGLFKWNFVCWITQKRCHLFQRNFSVIVARYHNCLLLLNLKQRISPKVRKLQITENYLKSPKIISKHPKPFAAVQNHRNKGICNRPEPAITARNRQRWARIYLELAVTGLKPSKSMWQRPQSFTGYLRPALVFMWSSTLQQNFIFRQKESRRFFHFGRE